MHLESELERLFFKPRALIKLWRRLGLGHVVCPFCLFSSSVLLVRGTVAEVYLSHSICGGLFI